MTKSPPFSNGTEWEYWSANWCDSCLVDAPYRNGISATGCPLILTAMLGETPAEWIEQETCSLGDRYHCVNFKGPGWRDPEPKPRPVPQPGPGLFPEPERGVRMLLPLDVLQPVAVSS